MSQGWSKNEIIYELQRIFGNDILLDANKLDDERSLATKILPVVCIGLLVSGMFLRGRIKTRQTLDLAKKSASNTNQKQGYRMDLTSKNESISKHQKSELMRKLKIDTKKL